MFVVDAEVCLVNAAVSVVAVRVTRAHTRLSALFTDLLLKLFNISHLTHRSLAHCAFGGF